VPRLFIEGLRYEALGSTALLEREYETLLVQHADVLFPGLLVVRFKPTVVYEGEARTPDLAFIYPNYAAWWVGEVELSHHPFEGHVVPQVEVLARASYGDPEADWLADREPDLDREAIKQMMRGAQPRVLVVVNAPCPDWVPRLRPDAEVMIVEPFRSARDRYIFRQNGYEIEVGGSIVSTCRADPRMPRMLVLDAPAAVVGREDDPIRIEYAGTESNWHVISAQDRVWLSPERGSPFPPDRELALCERDDGTLVFESLNA